MSTYIIYNTMIATHQRLGRDTSELALKIDTAFALGRLSDEEYAELILAVKPASSGV